MRVGGGGPAGPAGDAGAARGVGDGGDNPRFRKTLVRVLAVQVVTLILLWLLQAAYHG